MISFTDEQQERQLYTVLEGAALLGTLTALLVTFVYIGRGAVEMNPLLEAVLVIDDPNAEMPVIRAGDSPIWYLVGVLSLVFVSGIYGALRLLRQYAPKLSFSLAVLFAGIRFLNAVNDAGVFLASGGPDSIYWAWTLPFSAVMLTATALLLFRQYISPIPRKSVPFVSSRLPFSADAVEWRRASRKGFSIIFSFLLVSSVIAGVSFIATQPGPDSISTHGGLASADVESSSFSTTKNVSGEDNSPTDVTFNDDGTKMFVSGATNDNVYEYSLSTEFDVSTASHVQTLDVSGQDGDPGGIAFNTDGTKMFVAGNTGDSIYEYSLSTAFDISTASFVQSKDVSGQDIIPTGVSFNDDGTKMYMSGNSNDNVYEYSLSTEFDVSTASHSQTFDVSTQDDQPREVIFNGDGSKMFVVGQTNTNIFEYTLSTPYDISTATYEISFDVSGEDTAPEGISFDDKGSKMYVAGSSDGNIDEYDADISGYSYDLSGHVLDQNGDPVENATVYSVGYNTSDPPLLDTRNLEEVLDRPLPTEWQDQLDNIPRFKEQPEFDANAAADEWEKPRVLMHTSEDWNLNTVPHTREKVETVPADVQPRAITKPSEEQLFACWRFDGIREFGDGIDLSVVGGETTPCQNLTIERVDPLGATQYQETVEPTPLIKSRAAGNIGWSSDTGVAVKLHYGYRTDLGQGVYRVYPEGDQKRAMYYVVAPNNDPGQLKAEIQNWAGDELDRRTKFNDEINESYQAGNIDVQSTTTNETGHYGLNVDTNKVTHVELRAVKGGTKLNVDPQNLSQDHVRSKFETSVKSSFNAETAADFQTADQETFRSVCERMDSVLDDVGSPYVGSTSTSVPNDAADIEGVRLIPPDADGRVRKCAAINIAEQIANDPLSLLPGFTGDLADLTKAELEALYDDLMGLIGVNDALRSEVEDRVGSDLPDDGSSLSESDLRTAIHEGFQVVESPPGDGGFNDGGGSSLPGGGSDEPVIEDPEETQDRINETISRTWPVSGVGDINSSDVGVLIRIVYSDGSQDVLGPDSPYVTLEDTVAGADKVYLEEYPFGTGDAAVAEVSLDVTTPEAHARNRGRARNPTFDGHIPGLDAVKLSSSSPGQSDTITVGATPEDATRWGGVQHVNVTGPNCQKSVQATNNEAPVEMCGTGAHRLAVTYTNGDGAQFTEVVQVNARTASQARPPAIRAGAGPIGRYAIVANGLEDGRLKVTDGASVVTLTGIVPQESDAPNRVTASTTGVDVARDATTSVRLRQGDTEQVIRERVGVILHVDQVSEDSLLYRNGRPIRNPGETADAIVERRNQSTSIDSYTSETAEMSVKVSRDPSIFERFTHNVRLRFPSLPVGFALVPLPDGTVFGFAFVFAARRRRPPRPETTTPQEAEA